MSQEEDGQTQRPEVSEEDDTGTYNRLGKTGPAKSKTIQVMEDCEKRGKPAPSVFGGAKKGADLNVRSAGPIKK